MTSAARRRATVEVEVAFMLETEAAAYLRVAPQTLRHWRSDGTFKGPRYRRHGGVVVYAVKDLNEWSELQARLTTTKTAEELQESAASAAR